MTGVKKLRHNLFVNLIKSGVVDDSTAIPRKKSIPDSKKGYILHPLGPKPCSTVFSLAQGRGGETALETNFFLFAFASHLLFKILSSH